MRKAGNRLDHQVDIVGERLQALSERAAASPDGSGLLAEAVEELSLALEELQVAGEELHEQNEQLILAEQELEAERRRYRELFEFAPDGYVVTDAEGVISAVNQAASMMFGHEAQYLVGKPLPVFVPPEEVRDFRRGLARLRKTGQARDWEVTIQPREGQRFPSRITTAVIHDAAGTVVGLRWLLRDVTTRKLMEEELHQHRESLEERVAARTAELQEANVELERANREMALLASVAAHDLREPLRTVIASVQLLQRRHRGELPPGAVKLLERAVDGAGRLAWLMDDVLTYAQASSVDFRRHETDAAAVMDRVVTGLDKMINDTGAEITRDPLPTVLADEVQLSRVFHHLLRNALRFHGAEPPRVHVSAERTDEGWTFSVRDNGIGLPPEDAERIFRIFERLHTYDQYPGTGIGLAICRRIVERHNGRMWVESQPGAGSTFYFTLPAETG